MRVNIVNESEFTIKFRNNWDLYLPAACALIVFDVTDEQSFIDARNRFEQDN